MQGMAALSCENFRPHYLFNSNLINVNILHVVTTNQRVL